MQWQGYGLDYPGFENGKGKRYLIFSTKQADGFWGPFNYLPNWYLVFFQELKQPRYEADHSSPSTDDDKNEWNYTSAFVCLRGMNGERFPFIFVWNNMNWKFFLIFWSSQFWIVRQTGYTYFRNILRIASIPPIRFLYPVLKNGASSLCIKYLTIYLSQSQYHWPTQNIT